MSFEKCKSFEEILKNTHTNTAGAFIWLLFTGNFSSFLGKDFVLRFKAENTNELEMDLDSYLIVPICSTITTYK